MPEIDPSQRCFEELRGSRVLLRVPTADDTAAVWDAIEESRERLRPWLPWVNDLRTLDDERAAIATMRNAADARESINYGLFDRASRRYLGSAGFPRISRTRRTFEIGYWIRTSAERRGYITEAVQLLTDLAFDRLGAIRVEIFVDPRNARSWRIPERLGPRFSYIALPESSDRRGGGGRGRAALERRRVDLPDLNTAPYSLALMRLPRASAEERAEKYLTEHAGTHFDPAVVEAFVRMLPEDAARA